MEKGETKMKNQNQNQNQKTFRNTIGNPLYDPLRFLSKAIGEPKTFSRYDFQYIGKKGQTCWATNGHQLRIVQNKRILLLDDGFYSIKSNTVQKITIEKIEAKNPFPYEKIFELLPPPDNFRYLFSMNEPRLTDIIYNLSEMKFPIDFKHLDGWPFLLRIDVWEHNPYILLSRGDYHQIVPVIEYRSPIIVNPQMGLSKTTC